jgi:hypothetical protein
MIRPGQQRSGTARDELKNGGKFEGFEDFGWISRWRWWGKARSTRGKANPWSKSNKISSHQQITKNFGGVFLVGNFRIRTKNNKIKLENEGGRLRNRDQRGS